MPRASDHCCNALDTCLEDSEQCKNSKLSRCIDDLEGLQKRVGARGQRVWNGNGGAFWSSGCSHEAAAKVPTQLVFTLTLIY
jgi:hypothetical protein